MTKTLTHKGYIGSIDVSLEDSCMHGRIQFVDDIVTYEGTTVDEIAANFRDAVDRYLAHCRRTGKTPDKPCSGTFNVRLGSELHRAASREAMKTGLTLNDFVVKSVERAVAPAEKKTVLHEHRVVIDDLQVIDERLASSVQTEIAWKNYVQ